MKTCRKWIYLASALTLGGLASVMPAMAQIAQVVSATPTTRVVEHASGQSEIPAAPQRIFVLHNVFAEALTAMGLTPLGSVTRPNGMPSQLAEALINTETVGSHSEPDLERVLALAPDLILAQHDQQGDNYGRLSDIAPTLLLDEPEQDWRDWYRGLGEALGQPEGALAAIAAYDAKAGAAKAALAAKRLGETVLLLRVREKDMRVYGGARRSGPVLYQYLGLTPHAMVPLDEDHQEISFENLPELTADHIFIMVEDADKMTTIEQSDLWQRLPAVQAGQVHKVNIEPWNQSVGPISFGVIIDDVSAALL